jgi:hypothetical protein
VASGRSFGPEGPTYLLALGVGKMKRLRAPLSKYVVFACFSLLTRADWVHCACVPGWTGTVLISGDSLSGWSVEQDSGSSGTLQLADPVIAGKAVQLDWNIGEGDWVQGKFNFSSPVDLSSADIFGLSLRGDGSAQIPDTVSVMFADVNDVFYGYDLIGEAHGINQVGRPLFNIPLPKAAFYHFFSLGTATQFDWSRVDRFFVVVKRPQTLQGGGSGQLAIDQLQYGAAAQWPRQASYANVASRPQAAAKAIAYVLGQQKSTGLFLSWKEEAQQDPPPKSWLYDQALVLTALMREGRWSGGQPRNDAARAAKRLVDFLAGVQKADGHWARGWNPDTGEELSDDGWVGDQAWWVMALALYAQKAGDAPAAGSAQRGADWLVSRIDSQGKVVTSTEGNVDVWWALVATSRLSDAEKIKNHLLDANGAWDSDQGYWWRGHQDPVIAMDAATWLSAFSRHPLVDRPDMGLAALTLVHRTLLTTDDEGTLCGFDGMGPVSIWNEGTAQYLAAGGKDNLGLLDMLLSQQNADGSMPGSPDNWSTDAFGWLTGWSGLAPTAWLYFALQGSPFEPIPDIEANGCDQSIELESGETLTVNVRLDAGVMETQDADWWLVANTPGGWHHLDATGGCICWKPGFSAAYGGPLVNLAEVGALSVSGLPAGDYNFFLGVDTQRNGTLDLDRLYFDSVAVRIRP